MNWKQIKKQARICNNVTERDVPKKKGLDIVHHKSSVLIYNVTIWSICVIDINNCVAPCLDHPSRFT